jgi:hypothetical protein
LEPGSNVERLTNIRYADDLLLFAKSLPEAEAGPEPVSLPPCRGTGTAPTKLRRLATGS